MSTANFVPETWKLTGDDARKTLRDFGRWKLVRDAFKRLRVADGFSHARSMAYVTSLVLLQAIIALVGLASALGRGGASDVIVRTLKAAAPGPAGTLLTNAVTQAHRTGASHRFLGLAFGLVGALITGSTLMGQLERGLNRMYGVEQDRPSVQKYGLALVLTITTGLLASGAFALMAFGRTIGDGIDNSAMATTWAIVRWPIALVLIGAAITVLFQRSPRRRQPGLSWLAFGATVSVALWTVSTVALGAFFSATKSFGQTYGPLAGIVALLLWSLFSSIALLFGGAVAAQLEAIRVGASAPQDREKVAQSEPEHVDTEPVAHDADAVADVVSSGRR
jgi:YihY family inner membrane protein